MKKITLLISVFSLLFCFILTAILAWYGYFSSVTVMEKPVGPYTMVYKLHVGSPASVGPVLEEIHRRLQDEFKLTSLTPFGLYYDDPKITPPEQCRTLVGCIIEDDNDGDLHAISEAFTVAIFPRSMAVVVDYPYKNKLSVLFGMVKGYPALFDYVAEHDLQKKPVVEIYDTKRGRIRYVLSTALADSFFDAYLTLE